MRTRVSALALSLFLLVLAPGTASAQYDDGRDRGGPQPLDRILPEIRRDHPGRFYDAEGPFMGGDGQMHYRVKWMTPDGRVVWFDADARTGRVLGTGGGRHDYGNDSVPYDRDHDRDDRDRYDRPPDHGDNHRDHFDDDRGDHGGHGDHGGRSGGGGWGSFWGGGGGGGGGDHHHHGH
jgi:hypothetical protein